MRSELLLGAAVLIATSGSAWAGETVTLPGGVPLTLVIVPAGMFTMGSPEGESGRFTDEGPERDVTLSRSYYLGTHEITQGQWAAVYGNNPSGYPSCGQGCPVETVTWFEALAFANAVSAIEGLPSCYTLTDCSGTPGTGMTCSEATFVGVGCEGYRLPTEAEWARAARAGTTTRFSHGDVLACDDDCGSCALHDQHMWWCGNNIPSGTKATGSKTANGYGLFDMHGNVYEWVWDRYGLYPDTDETDPTGPTVGVVRVTRGGSYGYGARFSRSANRISAWPTSKGNSMGFRLARSTDEIFVDGFESGDTTLWSKTVP